MEGVSGGTDRGQGMRKVVATAGGTLVRRGVMFLLAHSLFLVVAVSLFAVD